MLNFCRWRWRSPRRMDVENIADQLLSEIPKLNELPRNTSVELVLSATVAASARTFRASVAAARRGYPSEAQMLNRALFEDMVSAYYLQLHPGLIQDLA